MSYHVTYHVHVHVNVHVHVLSCLVMSSHVMYCTTQHTQQQATTGRRAHPMRVGTKVIAKFGTDEDERWWPGTIVHLHHDGLIDVKYDDGDKETRKPLSRVRLPDSVHLREDLRLETENAKKEWTSFLLHVQKPLADVLATMERDNVTGPRKDTVEQAIVLEKLEAQQKQEASVARQTQLKV